MQGIGDSMANLIKYQMEVYPYGYYPCKYYYNKGDWPKNIDSLEVFINQLDTSAVFDKTIIDTMYVKNGLFNVILSYSSDSITIYPPNQLKSEKCHFKFQDSDYTFEIRTSDNAYTKTVNDTLDRLPKIQVIPYVK